jgi:hypothetical protein
MTDRLRPPARRPDYDRHARLVIAVGDFYTAEPFPTASTMSRSAGRDCCSPANQPPAAARSSEAKLAIELDESEQRLNRRGSADALLPFAKRRSAKLPRECPWQVKAAARRSKTGGRQAGCRLESPRALSRRPRRACPRRTSSAIRSSARSFVSTPASRRSSRARSRAARRGRVLRSGADRADPARR